MQADMFNAEICTINSSEGPALGVAILAGVASGVYEDVVGACDKIISVKTTQKPDSRNNAVYDKFYKIYKNLYVKLEAEYKETAKVLGELM